MFGLAGIGFGAAAIFVQAGSVVWAVLVTIALLCLFLSLVGVWMLLAMAARSITS